MQVGLSRTAKTRGAGPNPKLKKTYDEHLTGYVSWWRLVEKVARKIPKSLDTEKSTREDAKLAFLKKYYPGVHNSPSGTFRLEGKVKSTSRQMDKQRDRTSGGGAYSEKDFNNCRLLFSPKRKAEGTGLANLSSTSKKQKIISKTISYWNTLGTDNMDGQSGESDSQTKARSNFGGRVWK